MSAGRQCSTGNIVSLRSPTQRTLARLRETGWTAEVVERWNHSSKRRHDLFGCMDILAVKPIEEIRFCEAKPIFKSGVLGIQATSTSNISSRKSKCLAEPRLRDWLAAGAEFEIWGWALRGKRGKRKTYQLRRLYAVLLPSGVEMREGE